VPIRVHVAGAGPAVVFFHGPWGLTWGPFLDALAGFTVYAPEHPGTTPGDPDAIQHVDSWDLVLCYELLEQLRLQDVMLAGHSFGAMMACGGGVQPARVKQPLMDHRTLAGRRR
jgi:pimeloyl-ACP methyl ester carboxylesterase